MNQDYQIKNKQNDQFNQQNYYYRICQIQNQHLVILYLINLHFPEIVFIILQIKNTKLYIIKKPRLQKFHMIDQNAYLHSVESPNSLVDQRVVAFSEQLNSAYRPNFKKLKGKRKQYQSSIEMKQIFSVKSLQKIIMQQCQQRNSHCVLCECNYSQQEMFSLCKNHHSFCQHCLIEYISYKIGVMQQLRCPDEYCNQKAFLQTDIFQKIPEQLKIRYHRAQLWRQTISNPDLKLCPIQNCDGKIDIKQSPLICNNCRRQFCPQCMMEKHVGNCDTMYQTTHKEWRRCPSCRMFINKIQGCNHIRCRCSCEFCFVCLQNWDNSHYNCMQKTQMVYFDVDEVKCKLLIAIVMVILLPILIVLSAVGVVACFIVMIPVGFGMGLGLTVVKFIHLLCIVFILLPVGGAVGALVFPFYFTFGHILPYFVHHFRRYKITLQQLFANAIKPSK